MVRCFYETLLSSRTFSCEGVQEDVGRAPHVEAFHCKDTNSGEISSRFTGESIRYTVRLCRRKFERVNGVGQ
jgi:hypothetical protein